MCSESPWQGGGRCAAALGAVLRWLAAHELAAAGGVCRAWRHAAADGALWRRLLRPLVPAADRTLRLLREHRPHVSWRQEFVRLAAGWQAAGGSGVLRAAGGAPLQHAALDRAARRLALAADDASLTIWERAGDDRWELSWEVSLAGRGWSSVSRAQWADGGRLLLAGPLALADRWELLVLQPSADGGWRATARAGCAAGAAGCWAGDEGEAFLALELRRLAPRCAITTVWLNAATQEPQSEFAGVTTLLLHIYNEDSAHITHVLVASVPIDDPLAELPDDENEWLAPTAAYYRATDTRAARGPTARLLVCASYGRGGLLRGWPLAATRPAPLRAAGDLSARRRARAARPPQGSPPPPDEASVRALCSPPAAECRLQAAVLGLALHPTARCVWASTADGAVWSVALPALRPLLRLAPAAARSPADLCYLQPAAGARLVASPAPAIGRLQLWSPLSAAAGRPPPAAAAPALAAALLPALATDGEDALLVLAGDTVHVSVASDVAQSVDTSVLLREWILSENAPFSCVLLTQACPYYSGFILTFFLSETVGFHAPHLPLHVPPFKYSNGIALQSPILVKAPCESS